MTKLTPAQATVLRAAIRRRPTGELKAVFALVRAQNDRALLLAVAPAKKRAKKGDPLLRELQQTLKPVIAPAREKAEMLVEHLAKKHRKALAFAPTGMADAARRLRITLSDEQISAGAKSLMAHLAKLYGGRETVV